MKIVPIVLSTSIEEFREQLRKVSPLSRHLNFDFADGIAAPNQTLPLEVALEELLQFPEISKYKLDFDLMVKDWKPLVERLVSVGDELNINSAVVHQKYFGIPPATDFDLGLAVDLDDQLDFKLVSQVSLIQIMTINLGFQGTAFVPEALLKVTELRQKGFEGKIVIDGGVNADTLPLIMENKGLPDIVGVGGYLTRAADPSANYQKLEEVLTHYLD